MAFNAPSHQPSGSNPPAQKTVEELQKEKRLAELKEMEKAEKEREQLSRNAYKDQTLPKLYKAYEELTAKKTELNTAEQERNEVLYKDRKLAEEKGADVVRLTGEVAGLQKQYDHLVEATLRVQDMFTDQHDFILQPGEITIDAKKFDTIRWYPVLQNGVLYEYTSKTPVAGMLSRIRIPVENKPGEFTYQYQYLTGDLVEFRAAFAPGQKPPAPTENMFGEKFAEKEKQEEASRTLIDILNGPREKWEQEIAALLKNPEKTVDIKNWATERLPLTTAGFTFQQTLVTVILKENNAVSTDVMRIWMERIKNPEDSWAMGEDIRYVSELGSFQSAWIFDVYKEKNTPAPKDDRSAVGTGIALLAAAKPADKQAMDTLKQRYESEKDPAMRSMLLLLCCKSDPAFEATVASDTLLVAARTNKATALEVLSIFIKRNEPQTAEVCGLVLQDYFYYKADINRYKTVLLEAANKCAGAPEVQRLDLVTLCEDAIRGSYSGEPFFYRMIAILGYKERIPVNASQFIAMTDEELAAEVDGRVQLQARLEREDAALAKMAPEEREKLERQMVLRNQQRININKQMLQQMLTQAILDNIEATVELRARKDAGLLEFARPLDAPFPHIPNALFDEVEIAFLDAYGSLEWDESTLVAVLERKPDASIAEVLRKAVTPVLQQLFANGRLRQFGITDEKCNEWIQIIASDPEAQEDMLNIMKSRLALKLMDGDPALKAKIKAHFAAKKVKGNPEDELLKVFGKNAASREVFFYGGNSIFGGDYSYGAPTVIPAAVAAAAAPAAVAAAVVAGVLPEKKLPAEEKIPEKETQQHSPSLKELLENISTMREGNVEVSQGSVEGYNVLIVDSGSSTKAYLTKENGEQIPLPAPTIRGLNTVIIQEGDEDVVFYNLEKQQIEDPYEKKQDDILKDIFGIDQNNKVVHDDQINYISDGMHLFFRGASEILGGEHPLRALGIITEDDKIDRTRADLFRELFQYHMDDIRDWRFTDLLALTRLWETEKKFVFAPLIKLRGEP